MFLTYYERVLQIHRGFHLKCSNCKFLTVHHLRSYYIDLTSDTYPVKLIMKKIIKNHGKNL